LDGVRLHEPHRPGQTVGKIPLGKIFEVGAGRPNTPAQLGGERSRLGAGEIDGQLESLGMEYDDGGDESSANLPCDP
jgi:hypothetical protein